MAVKVLANNVTYAPQGQEEGGSPSASSLVELKIWLAENITNNVKHFRIYNNSLYKLNVPVPFTTIDIDAEIIGGQWVLVLKGTSVDFTNVLKSIYDAKTEIDDASNSSLTKTYSITKIVSLIDTAIADLLGSSPETLDTLQELATALGNDPNFATTLSTALGNRLRFDINNQNLTTAQKINALTNLGIPEITIQGAIVEVKNKTDLENFEIGDRFRMTPTGRYVAGEVLAVPLNLPADLDDNTKVKLYIDA